MLARMIFCQRDRHVLSIISIVLAITLMIIVSSISNSLATSLKHQVDLMGLDVSFLTANGEANSIDQIKNESERFICYYSSSYNDFSLVGIDGDLQDLFSLSYEGRLLNKSDYLLNENVAVLGYKAAVAFDNAVIGQLIYINSIPFRVVGIIEKTDNNVFIDFDNSIYIPLNYLQDNYSKGYYIISDNVISDCFNADDDYFLISQSQTKSAFNNLISFSQGLLAFLSSFSFIIAIIGLINSSLANLKSRIKEIGLKRTLGASTKQIFLEFIIEGVIIVLIALLISFFISSLILALIDSSMLMPFNSMLRISYKIAIIAVLSGCISAFKATKITIIESIR